MNIAILDDYLDAVRRLRCFSMLDGHSVRVWNDHTDDVEILCERLKDTEALVVIRGRTAITASLIERLNKLRIISLHEIFPGIDVDACTRRGVIIASNHPGPIPSYPTAELTWGLIIAAMRGIPKQMASLRAGKWQCGDIGTALRGRTLGIFGYGQLGALVAGYGKAFGMEVLVWGREASRERARADSYKTAADKTSFFEQCDVLSLHMRLVDATRGIVKATDLALMKPTALLVNTSRAGLIEPGALENALLAGRPGMAALDVYEHEPATDTSNPLFNLDNVVCTPHIGWVERDKFEAQFIEIFKSILAYATGKPINVGNPAVIRS